MRQVIKLLSGVLWDYLMFGTTISTVPPCACRDGTKPDGAAAVAEASLAQVPGPHKFSCFCVTPGWGKGLEKWGCLQEGNRGRLLKTFLESWKQEMFNQAPRKRKKHSKKRRQSLSEQPGCLWNPCSVCYDAEFQLAVLLKTAGTHYLRINTEPAFILKLTHCWELSLMRSCCCQLCNPHQQPRAEDHLALPYFLFPEKGLIKIRLADQEQDGPSPCCGSEVEQSLPEQEVGCASAKRTSARKAKPLTLTCNSLLIASQGHIRAFCNVNCVSVHHKSLSDGSSVYHSGGWRALLWKRWGNELKCSDGCEGCFVLHGKWDCWGSTGACLGLGVWLPWSVSSSTCPLRMWGQMFFSRIWETTAIPHPKTTLHEETLRCGQREVSVSLVLPALWFGTS